MGEERVAAATGYCTDVGAEKKVIMISSVVDDALQSKAVGRRAEGAVV
jgi:hypothetical protein